MTDIELQDGRIKYTSAMSFSKMKQLRKGVIVALLLDLDIPSSHADLDKLSAMNKPDLEKMLWDMVRREFHLGQSSVRGLC